MAHEEAQKMTTLYPLDYWWIWPLLTISAFFIVIFHEEAIKAFVKYHRKWFEFLKRRVWK